MLRNARLESSAAQVHGTVPACHTSLCDCVPYLTLRQDSQVFDEQMVPMQSSLQTGTAQFSPEATFGKSFDKLPGDFLWADRRACLTGPILQLAAEPPSEIDSWHGNELISPEMSSFY